LWYAGYTPAWAEHTVKEAFMKAGFCALNRGKKAFYPPSPHAVRQETIHRAAGTLTSLALILLWAACNNPAGSHSGPSLTGITITASPYKTAYTVGEGFNPAGLAVRAQYSNGESAPVTDYALTWNGGPLADGSTAITAAAGPQAITAAYRGRTAAFAISVAAAGGSGDDDDDDGGGDPAYSAQIDALNGTAEYRRVRLAWTDPADEDFDHVEITFSPPAAVWTQPVIVAKSTGAGGANGADIGGLATGIEYTFTVQAVDESGNKSAVRTVTAAPRIPRAIAEVTAELHAAPGGTSPGNPLILRVKLALGDSTEGWDALLGAIAAPGPEYIALDLSACTVDGMSGVTGEFDPGTANAGESKITTLILPAAAAPTTNPPPPLPVTGATASVAVAGSTTLWAPARSIPILV
jgi:hypothetical protein